MQAVFYEEGEPIIDGEPGDLRFRVRTTPHDRFKRLGNNLHTTTTITLAQALVGFEKTITHLDEHLVNIGTKVSMAMAAKAKILLRELKTVKADLAFAKESCAQLEEENRILRETGGEGDSPEDDDLIRLQPESLLAKKARLAQENSVYARENRFQREIMEYHQLTMQDVVYIDEHREEVSEAYDIKTLATNSFVTPSTPRTNPHVIGGISSPSVTPTSPLPSCDWRHLISICNTHESLC